jgi:hypothetical protein
MNTLEAVDELMGKSRRAWIRLHEAPRAQQEIAPGKSWQSILLITPLAQKLVGHGIFSPRSDS